ncbi:cytochrome c oxidase subunit 5b-1, mitochondrial-like isoform X1 [Rutidosis leptorrhynchoides]|uniref:cytochrome c oxidase subunit 5b-1, mitochondrial-like isoform X1 n=1 Tax=Rutidosis leptorrhynchoides TaxID=125765 RepID=UPI003A998DF3
MWRRVSSKLLALRSAAGPNRIFTPSLSQATLRPSATIVYRHFSGNVSKKVEDVMPIATGHEREELEAELQGRDILDINHPEGPFGTKATPAVVKSYYDQRIVGCPGAEGGEFFFCNSVDCMI